MAEAHSAVAFSFTISHEGFNINYDTELIYAVWQSGVRSWRKRMTKFWNHLWNNMYPVPPYSFLFVAAVVAIVNWRNTEMPFSFTHSVTSYIGLAPIFTSFSFLALCLIETVVLWLIFVNILRYMVKLLFMYKGWMYESRGGRKISVYTRFWLLATKMIVKRKPKLYSFQGSLPNLPLPALKDTMSRYLLSVRPLLDDEKYERMKKLTKEFECGIGRRLQRYLIAKSWWSANYVSDWWEEFIYLRGRGPLMINSNFYGIDAILVCPTSNQAARAANIIHACFLFRRSIDRETLNPIMVQGMVPLCSAQYERLFNTTRIPGKDVDKIVHLSDSQHVAVYHNGRYYKLTVYYLGRLMKPAEIQRQIEKILNDTSEPELGEKHLGALTAVERSLWSEVRQQYFSKGVNKASLDSIEKAAFFVSLDDECYEFDKADPSKLNHFGRAMLHGKGYDRWFDKSFNIIVGKNGRVGLNAEHSWADAPIMSHLWEFCLVYDIDEYNEDGNCKDYTECSVPSPVRMRWDLPPECFKIIDQCVASSLSAIDDVDLRLIMHDSYGKGFMKKCKVSPDAYIQMALQLAYFRDSNKFSLTYEASMTRLYREGRTETVRPVTVESCAWVRSMQNPNATDSEKQQLLRIACDRHQKGYQDAMCGKGIDRHMFCLYVVARYLEVESPFLNEVLSEPWRLSTSQTPHGQTDLMDLKKNPHHISAGGGFGPVADDGYGVSYIIAGEDIVFFHVSSKISSPETDSQRFSSHIVQALKDIKDLFEKKN